ncbi:MAG: glycosyltransferase family 39 protein [Ignavibacteria bacterium]|nr:glycosyltransferase family 39 protein [Ignavibacteria bacterium]
MGKILTYLDDKKRAGYVFLFLAVFLLAVKLPSIIDTDIQPWDEGMYATRVLSIQHSGDFFDQSSHSHGRFYSGSHPPLLIWAGYITGLVFGFNNVSLKLLIFLMSLAVLWMLIIIGRNIYSQRAGIIAAVIFSSNMIFNIFSKRFQFDIPYTLLILAAFYFFLKYIDTGNKKYNYYTGVVLGLCLMVKILVGFMIPMVIFFTVLVLRKKINYSVKDLIVMTAIGTLIALPWHIYMFALYGKELADYFFYYHIYERALYGVEQNTKGSGYVYHINYLLTILPYGVLVIFGALNKTVNFKKLGVKEVFMLVWFLTGFIIITLFRTKLEVYILLILVPGVIIAGKYLENLNTEKPAERLILLLALSFNIFWAVLNYTRIELGFHPDLHSFRFAAVTLSWFIVSLTLLLYYYRKNYSVSNLFLWFIVVFFAAGNLLFAFRIPYWENSFRIRDVKSEIEKSGYKNLVYVASNYRHNPQFSFYFDGIDLGWGNGRYNFKMFDTKYGTDAVRDSIEKTDDRTNIIVERDKINRAEYPETKLFIPGDFILVMKSPGYELYRKKNWK